MRLTADLLAHAAVCINPVRERQIDIRGYKIPAIENLGVTQDQFDSIDLSDNEIKKLENFPRLRRLKTLLMNNNYISRIGANLGESLPELEALVLTKNKIGALSEIDELASLPALKHLSLLSNPVTERQYYRLYVIHHVPQLRVLDFTRIKMKERKEANRLFRSSAGKQMEADVQQEAAAVASGDITAGGLSLDQVAAIKLAIANASTPEEVDRLERQLRAGIIPGMEKPAGAGAGGDADPAATAEVEVEGGEGKGEGEETAMEAE